MCPPPANDPLEIPEHGTSVRVCSSLSPCRAALWLIMLGSIMLGLIMLGLIMLGLIMLAWRARCGEGHADGNHRVSQ